MSQKIIPFPRVKKFSAALPNTSNNPGPRPDDDIEAMLNALRHAHAIGQIKGAVLSLRTDSAEGLYLVGDYAIDLDAAQQAVDISALVIQAKRRAGSSGALPPKSTG